MHDIHLQMRGKSAEVAYRLDGVITPDALFPRKLPNASSVICGAIASVVWIFSLILAVTGFLSYLLRSN